MPKTLLILAMSSFLCGAGSVERRQVEGRIVPDLMWFFEAASRDKRQAKKALDQIAASWKDSYAAMVLEVASLIRPAPTAGSDLTTEVQPLGRDLDSGPAGTRGIDLPGFSSSDPDAAIRSRLIRFLEKQTGKRWGDALDQWYKWIWSVPYDPHPQYTRFKGILYANIDPRMGGFFPPGVSSLIRLDEVVWGGVQVNGIPPLDYPKHISSAEAKYLKDTHIVFGIALNGEARAYPKRILAWHEMARDRVGGVEVTIVYCTLCGTVIPYESQVGGQLRKFGTSGLLYRSNKLMFDEQSSSLWSTLEGKPVIGSLAGSGLQLRSHPVVTTTWGEWKADHPNTSVLSPDTGHKRDYSEGAAYREYFSTDRLMFTVPKTDRRLKNKEEVLVMLLPPISGEKVERRPLAIATVLLNKNPVLHAHVAGHDLVVITTRKGANRVYNAGPEHFTVLLRDSRVQDIAGRSWRVTEEAMVLETNSMIRLPRVPAQRAFWFGWYAQFPNTELLK